MKIGFIGAGNMATAMISGIISSKKVEASNIYVSNISMPALKNLNEEYKVNISLDNKEVVKNSDVIFVAVKPNIYEMVLKEISPFLDKDKIIVSIAPGKTLDLLESWVYKGAKIIRTMPNTPAMALEGMTAVCKNENVSDEEFNAVINILEGFSKSEVITENLFDAVAAVSGSSPAYVYMFIEAMADGAVLLGMNRQSAYKFSAQSVLGAAKMVLETGEHPAVLKDNVCSPGGTTIEAVKVLEDSGMRSAILNAMRACHDKSKGM